MHVPGLLKSRKNLDNYMDGHTMINLSTNLSMESAPEGVIFHTLSSLHQLSLWYIITTVNWEDHKGAVLLNLGPLLPYQFSSNANLLNYLTNNSLTIHVQSIIQSEGGLRQ